MKAKEEKKPWYKEFSTAEEALTEMVLEGFWFDFKNQRERVKAWKFNLVKFKTTMSEKQLEDFVFWIAAIESKGTKI